MIQTETRQNNLFTPTKGHNQGPKRTSCTFCMVMYSV